MHIGLLKKMFRSSRGEALVSGAISIAVLFSIFAFAWQNYQGETYRAAILNGTSASFSNIEAHGFPTPFVFKRLGDFIPYNAGGDADLVLTNLTQMGKVMLNDISQISGVSAVSAQLQCGLKLGYLELVNGAVASTPSIIWGSDSVGILSDGTAGSVNSAIITKLSTLENDLRNRASGAVFVGADAQFQLPSDPVVTQVFFNYAPFLLWACRGNPGVLSAVSSAVLVGNVQFLPRN